MKYCKNCKRPVDLHEQLGEKCIYCDDSMNQKERLDYLLRYLDSLAKMSVNGLRNERIWEIEKEIGLILGLSWGKLKKEQIL
jgi:hypothetical protein